MSGSKRAVLAVASVLLIAALGGTAGCALFRPSPEKALASTTKAIASVKTMRFTMDLEMESAGQKLPMTIEGVIEAPTESKLSMTTTLYGQTSTMEQIVVGGKAYVKYPQSPEWGVMDLDITTSAPGQGTTPTSYLSFLESFSAVEDLGTEKVDGVECYHYSMEIDETRIVDVMLEQSKAQGVSFNDESIIQTLRDAYKGAEITAEVWVGVDDMLPRKEVIDMALKGATPMKVTGTVTFADFDKPVDITAPASAISMEELTKKIVKGAQ